MKTQINVNNDAVERQAGGSKCPRAIQVIRKNLMRLLLAMAMAGIAVTYSGCVVVDDDEHHHGHDWDHEHHDWDHGHDHDHWDHD